MRTLVLTVAALLAVYAAWLSMLYVGQRGMMFPGAGMAFDAGPSSPDGHVPGVQPVAIPASFGHVRGYLLAAASPGTAPALVYFHGNAEFAAQNIELLQPLAAIGLHVLIVEYPGYAGSDGKPGRSTLDEAARVAFDWLAKRTDVAPERIVAMGRSIGAGPAVSLARDRPLAALVLLSGFSSLDGFAHRMGAPAFLIRDRWDNASILRSYRRPVLLFHGRSDGIIPFAHSRVLARAAPHARLEALECGHNDCPYFDRAFVETLAAFLREAGVLSPRAPMPPQPGHAPAAR